MRVSQQKNNGKIHQVEFFVEHFSAVSTIVIRDGLTQTELHLSETQCELLQEILSKNLFRWRNLPKTTIGVSHV